LLIEVRGSIKEVGVLKTWQEVLAYAQDKSLFVGDPEGEEYKNVICVGNHTFYENGSWSYTDRGTGEDDYFYENLEPQQVYLIIRALIKDY